jgi:L-lactate permease
MLHIGSLTLTNKSILSHRHSNSPHRISQGCSNLIIQFTNLSTKSKPKDIFEFIEEAEILREQKENEEKEVMMKGSPYLALEIFLLFCIFFGILEQSDTKYALELVTNALEK